MEIKTTKEIWQESECIIKNHDFIPNENQKWVSMEDLKKVIKHCDKNWLDLNEELNKQLSEGEK